MPNYADPLQSTGQRPLKKCVSSLSMLSSHKLIFILAFVRPYIFSVLPPGTVQIQQNDTPSNSVASYIPTTVLQIQSTLSSQIMQKLAFPFNATTEPTAVQNALIRFLTPTNSNKSPLYLITTPTDKTALATEGSSIWTITMKSWAEQLDELVLAGQYLDALALLDIIDGLALSDKVHSLCS